MGYKEKLQKLQAENRHLKSENRRLQAENRRILDKASWSMVNYNNAPPYDPDFGDHKVCGCGHEYHRHFDSYEDMNPVGCKYCDCDIFAAAAKVMTPSEFSSRLDDDIDYFYDATDLKWGE